MRSTVLYSVLLLVLSVTIGAAQSVESARRADRIEAEPQKPAISDKQLASDAPQSPQLDQSSAKGSPQLPDKKASVVDDVKESTGEGATTVGKVNQNPVRIPTPGTRCTRLAKTTCGKPGRFCCRLPVFFFGCCCKP